jgi:hypothetical protein
VDAALYGTIWIALTLFAAGEAGKRGVHQGRQPAPWAWWASAAGVTIAAVHVVIAMGAHHGWSHQSAVLETARQTASVYGLDWGGGVYVNYAFIAIWGFEVWQWCRAPVRYASRSPLVTWSLRVFYLIMFLNGAIVFVPGWRRLFGAALLAVIVASWTQVPGTPPAPLRHPSGAGGRFGTP